MPQFRLTFDIGRGYNAFIELPRLLLTHGHLDHASGLPYYVSQRSLRKLSAPDIYCPAGIQEPMNEILKLWSRIENFEIKYNLIPVSAGTDYPLDGRYVFRATPTTHRVEAYGYTILEKNRKIKPEYRHLTGPEIAEKKATMDLFYENLSPIVTYSGDTQIEFVLENEIVRQSRILILECTYLDEKRPVSRARKWGHIHLDEIIHNKQAFEEIERLYLIHISPRYKMETISHIIQQKLPLDLARKTTVFMQPENGRRLPADRA